MWLTIAIAAVIIYVFSKITGIQIGEVIALALGLFLSMGVCVDVYAWFKRWKSPYYDPGGEPGSGMDDGD